MNFRNLDPYELCNALAVRGIKAEVLSESVNDDGETAYEIGIQPPIPIENIELNFDLNFE